MQKILGFFILSAALHQAAIDMQAERIHSWKSGPRDESVNRLEYRNLDLQRRRSVKRVTREEDEFDALCGQRHENVSQHTIELFLV